MWEKFGDVDGQGAEFVDSDFIRSTPAGGDYAGETGESTLAAIEAQMAGVHLSGSPEYVPPMPHISPVLIGMSGVVNNWPDGCRWKKIPERMKCIAGGSKL